MQTQRGKEIHLGQSKGGENIINQKHYFIDDIVFAFAKNDKKEETEQKAHCRRQGDIAVKFPPLGQRLKPQCRLSNVISH